MSEQTARAAQTRNTMREIMLQALPDDVTSVVLILNFMRLDTREMGLHLAALDGCKLDGSEFIADSTELYALTGAFLDNLLGEVIADACDTGIDPETGEGKAVLRLLLNQPEEES